MPYVYEQKSAGSPYFLGGLTSPTSEVLTEQFAQAFEENPIVAVSRWNQLTTDMRTGKRLTKAEAEARMAEYGVAGHLKIDEAGITENGLKTLMDRKRVELRRQEIFGRAKGGLAEGTARLGVAFGTAASDPLNAGLAFVPVVGQARYARWLAGAKGVLGRTGVRAAVGSVEGAAGAAIVEPVIYGSRTAEQADYDTVDSLMNVAFGGVFGATLHTGVGSLADVAAKLRFHRDRVHEVPFEFDEPQGSVDRADIGTTQETVTPRTPSQIVEGSKLPPEFLTKERARLESLIQDDRFKTGESAVALDYLTKVLDDHEEGLNTWFFLNGRGEIVAGASAGMTGGAQIEARHLGSIQHGAGVRLARHMTKIADELGLRTEIFARPGSEALHRRMGFKETGGPPEQGGTAMVREPTPRAQHIEDTRTAVGQAVNDQPVDVVSTKPKRKKRDIWYHGSKTDPLAPREGVQSDVVMFPGAVHLTKNPHYASVFATAERPPSGIGQSGLEGVPNAEGGRVTQFAPRLDPSEIFVATTKRYSFAEAKAMIEKLYPKEFADRIVKLFKEKPVTGENLLKYLVFDKEGKSPGGSTPSGTTRRSIREGFGSETENVVANLKELGFKAAEYREGTTTDVLTDFGGAPPVEGRSWPTFRSMAVFDPETLRATEHEWIEGTRGPDPEVAVSERAADEVPKEVPEEPIEAIDESMANAESDLKETESRLEQEEPGAEDSEIVEMEEAEKRANGWAKASEIATSCILKGTL